MAKRGRKKDKALGPAIFIRFSVPDGDRLRRWVDGQRVTPTISEVVRVAVAEFLDREGAK